MRKATRISYNPFTNLLRFAILNTADGTWGELSESSDLLRYSGETVLFSNCVNDIVHVINQKQNSSADGMEVQFSGPDSDFSALERAVRDELGDFGGRGPISCVHIETYRASGDALGQLRSCYASIAREFWGFLPGQPGHTGDGAAIGDAIAAFEETVSDAIPVCVIGNMSVGKSALINALVGEEVLPSKENPTTARNARILESDRFAVSVTVEEPGEGPKPVGIEIRPGEIVPEGDDALSAMTCDRLAEVVAPGGKGAAQIAREIVDFLNEAPDDDRDRGLLAKIGWNITLEVPFRHEYATGTESPVILFDTPGSDNADVNHEKHEAALAEFLGCQTNALPVLVTCRDQIIRQDTNSIREQIDGYAQNFASPCCIVVLTKCDNQTKRGLEERIPTAIQNWHGKSVVLYTTPVGALGYRRDDGVPWIDESYEEIFENWVARQSGRNRVSLPEYNINPREEGITHEDLDVTEDLFDTGIPSLEHEIAHYIDNYARYKKCARGRGDLLGSLRKVKLILAEQERRTERAKRRAEEKRRQVRAGLVEELDAIVLPGADGMADRIAPHFSADLDSYCDALPEVLGQMYNAHGFLDPIEMNRRASEKLREHCQRHLIDDCYLRDAGARDRIVSAMTEIAWNYAQELQEYVESNDGHFTETGSATLRDYLEREPKTPEFAEVRSVLDNIAEVFEQIALMGSGVLRLLNRPEAARANWVNSKRAAFEGRLRDGTTLLGEPRHGAFNATILDAPIEAYYAQLSEWAERYKGYIESQLDDENSVLSGMENEIRELEDKASDLRRRLTELSGVEEELRNLLEPIRIGGHDAQHA